MRHRCACQRLSLVLGSQVDMGELTRGLRLSSLRASEILANEPNLLEVDAPITGKYCLWPVYATVMLTGGVSLSLRRHPRTIRETARTTGHP